MATTSPVFDSDFDAKTSKFLAVPKSHRDILDVEDHEWGTIHRTNRSLGPRRGCFRLCRRFWLRMCCNVLLREVDGERGYFGYSFVRHLGSSLLIALISIVSSSLRSTPTATATWLLIVVGVGLVALLGPSSHLVIGSLG